MPHEGVCHAGRPAKRPYGCKLPHRPEQVEEDIMDAQISRYHEVYARWQRDAEGFWGEAAQEIDWIVPAKRVFDPNVGIYGRWFVGGVCNTCWNAVDRHVMQGHGE